MKKILILVVSSFLLFSALLTSCSFQKNSEKNNHIHTIVFDPTEENTFYLATHYYLEKHFQGKKEQVGSYGDDLMGFVIASDGSFYASGHSPSVNNVGIRKSTDKGKTWQTLAYEGLDFHEISMSYATPLVIYAWSTPPREFLTISRDGGKTWQEVKTEGLKGTVFSLTADHQLPTRIYAGTLYGLFVSNNEGKNWQEVPALKNNPVIAIADAPTIEGTLYVATQQGVFVTKNEGIFWEKLNNGLEDITENILGGLAINPHSEEIYGITKHSTIYRYEGELWKEQKI